MSYLYPSDLQESELISRASAMDLEAFNRLVLKYQDLVYYHAYALLGDHHAAEDATQESFLKAFKNMDKFRGGSFRPWLMKIATNTCYDELRKGRRYSWVGLYTEDEYGEELENPAWIADPNASVPSLIEQKELSQKLYRLISELPVEYRSALTLVDLNGMDYAESARALGVPLGTLKSRLARARFLMRKKLCNHLDPSANFVAWNASSICA
jgi:RNA polymerase sigma-70 factor (ECF subfamily)